MALFLQSRLNSNLKYKVLMRDTFTETKGHGPFFVLKVNRPLGWTLEEQGVEGTK